jgi:AraC-like DNA-binding protein
MGLRSLTEAIDTSTPGGTLVFHLFGALAEFERAMIRERTRAGLTAARALLKDPTITMEDVAKRLQVSPATLYRHFPGGRGSLGETTG